MRFGDAHPVHNVNHTMSLQNDPAGATLAPAWEMHFSHQGKPLLTTCFNPHVFGRRVATWQGWHDWQVQAV